MDKWGNKKSKTIIIESGEKDITQHFIVGFLNPELDEFYKYSKFIKIRKLNTQIGSGNVLNTNNCEISICKTRFKNRSPI